MVDKRILIARMLPFTTRRPASMRRLRLAAEIGLFLATLVGLVMWQANVVRRHSRLDSALIAACIRHDNSAAACLLDQGANPNAHLVPDVPQPIWRVLLDRLRGRKPPPNTSDTALLVVHDSLVHRPAVARNANLADLPREDVALVRLLIKYGANVNARNRIDDTPLELAVGWNYTESALLLIDHGADVNLAMAGGETPLMAASTQANMRLIRALIRREANLNAQNCIGTSALMYASGITPHADVVRELLARGANVSLLDRKKHSALYTARSQSNNEQIIRLLERAGTRE